MNITNQSVRVIVTSAVGAAEITTQAEFTRGGNDLETIPLREAVAELCAGLQKAELPDAT